MRIIFFGTPEIARIILEKLAGTDFKPIHVVTSPDEPVGRSAVLTPPPVKICAEKNGIPVLQPKALNDDFIETISRLQPDLFIVAAYGKIFPARLLEVAPGGGINVHFSLLPLWRGASPIQHSILHGDKQTGVTIMLMDEKLDHGPVLIKKAIPMPKDATAESLSKELAELSGELLLETIPLYAEGKIQPRDQDHEKATYCKLLRKEDGRIDWSFPAPAIERQMRAFTPWPGTYTFWDEKRIKIHGGQALVQRGKKKQPGTVIAHNRSFAIQTGKGFLIPSFVQMEGKARVDTETFLRGYPAVLGSILE